MCHSLTKSSDIRDVCFGCDNAKLLKTLDCLDCPGNDGGVYFPRLSKNTPCSPNMFHTHQGRFSGTGRP